jgi:ribosomal 50S subunit-recycling heat shock protein
MRLDVFLKLSRLVKRRPLASDMCAEGRILLNGAPAKAGHVVRQGDELEIRGEDVTRRVRVLSVPEGQQTKAQAAGLYELLAVHSADPLG